MIFLDIQRDLYFRLPPSLEKTFLDYTTSSGGSSADISGLIDRNVLVPASVPHAASARLPLPPARRSAIETSVARSTPRVSTLMEVSALVWRTRRQLRTGALKDVLDSLSTDERGARDDSSVPDTEPRLVDAAGQFMRTRRYVPVDPICLLDSVSMIRFLARRHLRANIVFAVTDEPFAAHCWVQAGDMVLNDTVGNVGVYTPIRWV